MSEVHMHPVPAAVAAHALIDNAKYLEMYRASVDDPEAFWSEQGKRLDWIKTYTKVKNTSYAYDNVSINWFEDGTLNVFLADCTIDAGEHRGFHPGTYVLTIPLTDATRKGDISRGPSHCPLRRIRRERFEQRQHAFGVIEIPPHVSVGHDVDVFPNRLAHRANQRDVLLHSLPAIDRPPTEA